MLTVLSLHRISDENNGFWDPIRPHTFDKLLQYVKTHYRVIRFDQLSEIRETNGKPYLILSFDDGYYDFYEHALPLLVKHGLPANHNIVDECAENNSVIWTERLNVLFEFAQEKREPLTIQLSQKELKLADFGNNWMLFYLETFRQLLNMAKDEREIILAGLENKLSKKAERRMMNWDEIKECSSNNVEIGSHTYSHDSLSTITDKQELEHQITYSRTNISNKLGQPVRVLALPNGQTGVLADAVIGESEFEYVLLVDEQLNTLPMSGIGQRRISRINLVNEPFPQMALRVERFHETMRKYV